MVEYLICVLEHQNGSTSQNVVHSPLTSQLTQITSVESWAKLWYNFLDHIFDHNELFLLIQYPGVAQLVGRLVWEIDRVSQTCYNPKCKTRWHTKQIRINPTQF